MTKFEIEIDYGQYCRAYVIEGDEKEVDNLIKSVNSILVDANLSQRLTANKVK